MVSVFEDLRTAGHFFDPVEREVRDDFLPWLSAQVSELSERWAAARVAVQVQPDLTTKGRSFET